MEPLSSQRSLSASQNLILNEVFNAANENKWLKIKKITWDLGVSHGLSYSPPSSIAKANKLAPIYTIVNTLDRGEIIIIIIIRRGEERIELKVELWKWLEL